MNIKKTIEEYLNELSSNSPTPGGGNVSALCGSLSASLGTMVCNLTIGKKKYADVEEEMKSLKVKLEKYISVFTDLAARDNAAFDRVMEAFKLPKETEEEKEIRAQKIEEATFGAAEVPAEVIRNCSEVLPMLRIVALKGNRNSLSDAGVAALLISAAAQGAYLNVLINCSSLSNQTHAQEILKRADILLEEIKNGSSLITDEIVKSLRA